MSDLALFDFDGTLTTSETFGRFIRAVATPRRLAAGRLLLAPLVAGYRLGLVPGTVVRAAVVRFALRDRPLEAIEAQVAVFAGAVLPGLLRAGALERVRWHQARGDTVAVVSGAFDVYLAPWCREHGVDLLCSRLERRGGRLTGRYAGAQCVGEEKARQVRARYDLARYGSVHAYGDTREDLALLALAQQRYYRWRELPSGA